MRWIEARQRIQKDGMFLKGRIWSSGYVVAKNGIDIEDAFIMIRLPFSTQWAYCPWTDDFRCGVHAFWHTRGRGWFHQLDFTAC